MPRPWLLRHKLLFALGLVVGSVALLAGGTFQGLSSYFKTVTTSDARLVELLMLSDLKPAVNNLFLPTSPPAAAPEVALPALGDDPQVVSARIQKARDLFEKYKARYQENLELGRDRESKEELEHIGDIDKAFDNLQQVVDAYFQQPRAIGASQSLADDRAVQEGQRRLSHSIDLLSIQVARDIFDGFHDSRGQYRWGIGLNIAGTALALILILTIIHLFSIWVFAPIRSLQAGVQRVAGGDFEHPIELNSGDELAELATAFNDMTRRLHDIYRDLERQVSERSRQLVRSERMVSVGFLAAGVAHEINNPLASIAFCSEALESRLAELLHNNPQETEVVVKYLRMIQQEAFRCKAITGKLLDFSRVGERRREPTDLAALIQSVLEIAQLLQNCRGKRIVFHPFARPVAAVNAQDIKSVVLNLVVNALDSMEEGGTLNIALVQRGPDAEMVFADSGCGMPAEVLENIFEPFFTRNRTGKGTGLGLFISHQIIDQHGGTIHAASAGPNQGSTFTVRVPLQPAQPGPGGQPERDADVLAFGRAGGTPQTEDGIGHAAA